MNDLLFAFYGDDFTGSTDALEALSLAGVTTSLFLEPPSEKDVAGMSDVRAIGIAGTARAMTRASIEADLPEAFTALRRLGAPLTHYKICSTFDSSPEIGSIGRAIELAREIFGGRYVPLVVGVPRLGRYTVFGNLFARTRAGGEVVRLDRHPTMRAHPVTPMSEADLLLHLARQTHLSSANVSVLEIDAGGGAIALERAVEEGAAIVHLDVLTPEHLDAVGEILWTGASVGAPFVVGSSGVEYALASLWRRLGEVTPSSSLSAIMTRDRLIVVSGSCSPVTSSQVECALAKGFAGIPIDATLLLDEDTASVTAGEIVGRACTHLRAGRSVVLHTCRGPSDPRLESVRSFLKRRGLTVQDARIRVGQRLGEALGRILHSVLIGSGVRRALVTGGDTSGYVARQLGIHALSFVAPLAPGTPLCRVRSEDTVLDGLEIAFKGGQVGGVDFFDEVRRGVSS